MCVDLHCYLRSATVVMNVDNSFETTFNPIASSALDDVIQSETVRSSIRPDRSRRIPSKCDTWIGGTLL
jgi:hypothetical protein